MLTLFLERVSGWASDGVQLPPELLKRIVTTARETPSGKNAIVEMVRSR